MPINTLNDADAAIISESGAQVYGAKPILTRRAFISGHALTIKLKPYVSVLIGVFSRMPVPWIKVSDSLLGQSIYGATLFV